MKDFVVAKNDLANLNVFFYKNGLIDKPYNPYISHIRVDSSKNVNPAWHIGFKHHSGYTKGKKVSAGTIMFEVPEGIPMQEVMFHLNSKSDRKRYYYSLEDLPPLDLYVLNKGKNDPYGEFVIRDVQFIETRIEHGVNQIGRYCVAQFLCLGVVPFNTIKSYNRFICSNYENAFIHSDDDFKNIQRDIMDFKHKYGSKADNETLVAELARILKYNLIKYAENDFTEWVGFSNQFTQIADAFSIRYSEYQKLAYKYDIYMDGYKHKQSSMMNMFSEFIKVFYRQKNYWEERDIAQDGMKRQVPGEL